MPKRTTQKERLDYLVEAFKADSGTYARIETPPDETEKRQLLRGLMNIRPPRAMSAETLKIQDEYLSERLREQGAVTLADIPEIRPGLSLWQGDITRLQVDAILNAANSQMLGCFVPCHACIDNCIHTFAGVQLRQACARQMDQLRAEYGPGYEQPTAVPMLTEGFNLPAKHVIHIVGPIVTGPLTAAHERALADCYKNTLDMCGEHGLRTLALCCLSTGVFRFPNRRAAEIAVSAVEGWLWEHPGQMDRVIFNVFKDEDKEIYEQLLR